MSSIFTKLSIIGLSGVGYTVARSLHALKIVEELAAFDINYENMVSATRESVVDNIYTDLSGTLINADFIIINMNHTWVLNNLKEINSIVKNDSVITDLVPIKEQIAKEVEKCDTLKCLYTSSIPLILNKSEFLNEKATILSDNFLIFSKFPYTKEKVVKKVKYFWDILGVKVVDIDLRRADKALTAISQVPYLLFLSLFETIRDFGRYEGKIFDLWGNNFKLLREILLGDSRYFDEYLFCNKANLIEFISRVKDSISILESKIKNNDSQYFTELFNEVYKEK